ncbi:MAG: molybdopterin molybdenumtransferase MoeA, partial [Clostridia bacterium]|nr:molybdopterin molybdenumtransferase MoeA [Clostridia bacterium]
AMKPGKPSIVGNISSKPVFGLPGHPVAAHFVTAVFVRALIDAVSGRCEPRRSVKARLTEPVSANHGRAQYGGVFLCEAENGELLAEPIRGKSGLISSLAGCDGYFCIPRDCEGLPAGAAIDVYTDG